MIIIGWLVDSYYCRWHTFNWIRLLVANHIGPTVEILGKHSSLYLFYWYSSENICRGDGGGGGGAIYSTYIFFVTSTVCKSGKRLIWSNWNRTRMRRELFTRQCFCSRFVVRDACTVCYVRTACLLVLVLVRLSCIFTTRAHGAASSPVLTH